MLTFKGFFRLFILLFLFTTSYLAAADYTKYVQDIENRFNKAHHLYKIGETEEAKLVVQSGYFEVFENLEGPIRTNISGKKSYLMEKQFGDLRKMIKANKTPQELKLAMDTLINEMYEVLPEINEGFVLVAEVEHINEEKINITPIKKEINPTWQKVIDNIQEKFNSALEAYDINNSKRTRALIQEAQFGDYRNGALETAIKKYISGSKERNTQKKFTDLIKFIHTKPSKELVKHELNSIISSLTKLARGLPTVKQARIIEVKEVKKKDYSKVVESINKEIKKALDLYQNKKNLKAIEIIQNTYFDIFEESGMEASLGAKDIALKTQIESYFSKLVAQIKNESKLEDINKEFSDMNVLFDEALEILHAKDKNFITMFIFSLLIILREGFEALLIITAIIAYLVKSGNESRLNIVYNALFTAIILSFLTAFGMNLIFGAAAAQNREILEGSVMLIASGLLLYVSYWLLSNAASSQWTNYIKDNVKSSLDKNSVRALWFTVFLAVYREGAETVLFYQALISDAVNNTDYLALTSGFLVGIVALVILYIIMKFTAIKLPIKPFFIFTAVFIYFMAFTFIGQGVMEFVAGKIIEPTLIQAVPTIAALSIYPYLESLIPQAIVLLLGIWASYILLKRRKQTLKK